MGTLVRIDQRGSGVIYYFFLLLRQIEDTKRGMLCGKVFKGRAVKGGSFMVLERFCKKAHTGQQTPDRREGLFVCSANKHTIVSSADSALDTIVGFRNQVFRKGI